MVCFYLNVLLTHLKLYIGQNYDLSNRYGSSDCFWNNFLVTFMRNWVSWGDQGLMIAMALWYKQWAAEPHVQCSISSLSLLHFANFDQRFLSFLMVTPTPE